MKRPVRGMTLIEVLVAMAIFAILAALAYGALNRTLDSADILGDRMARLQAVQRAVRLLEQDFMQLAPRPVRRSLDENASGALDAGFAGVGIELTRAGWNNPAALPRGTLQRVAYWTEENTLIRAHWNVLDRTLSNEPIEVELLDDIEDLQIRYMLDNGEWASEWPPGLQAPGAGLRQRPRAVEIVLRLPAEGDIRRLVEVAP